MEAGGKRKQGPGGGGDDGSRQKRSKGGNQNRWQTPHHKAKMEALKDKGRVIEPGDMGFYVTCQRSKERQALAELTSICEDYVERIYGIKVDNGEADGDKEDGEDGEDIEAAIQKELDSIQPANKSVKEAPFDGMRFHIDCLLFMRTRPPIDPVQLVRRICEDAKAVTDEKQRRSRFLNRFTPITVIGKATEAGVDEVGKAVLRDHFLLKEGGKPAEELQRSGGTETYAIRFSSRAHNSLKRDDVIKQVAGLIDPAHVVNLKQPEKVILVDIFQTHFGMSVVPGDWDSMKKYNLYELYGAA